MGVFRYEALDTQGKTSKGTVEADSARAARSQLRLRGLTPIQVESAEAQQAASAAGRGLLQRDLGSKDVVLLTRNWPVCWKRAWRWLLR